MNSTDYVAVFKRAPSAEARSASDILLLPEWSEEDWKKLLVHTVPQRFRASEVVIQRDATGRVLFFVVAGSLEVGYTQAEGMRIAPLARIGVGSVIGEQSFFDGQPRSASVWAVSDGELLCLSFEAFNQFGQADPALARDLLFALGGVLSRRLRNATYRIGR